ncbi:hypothetical protein FOCC_FOCC004378 [Frankliniella occidentalis]|nr:hypothetical protein FOCC_FOCC004378 [Frankliniella occidentalis]
MIHFIAFSPFLKITFLKKSPWSVLLTDLPCIKMDARKTGNGVSGADSTCGALLLLLLPPALQPPPPSPPLVSEKQILAGKETWKSTMKGNSRATDSRGAPECEAFAGRRRRGRGRGGAGVLDPVARPGKGVNGRSRVATQGALKAIQRNRSIVPRAAPACRAHPHVKGNRAYDMGICVSGHRRWAA